MKTVIVSKIYWKESICMFMYVLVCVCEICETVRGWKKKETHTHTDKQYLLDAFVFNADEFFIHYFYPDKFIRLNSFFFAIYTVYYCIILSLAYCRSGYFSIFIFIIKLVRHTHKKKTRHTNTKYRQRCNENC